MAVTTAAVLTGVGLLTTATTTGMSFAQANKNRKLQAEAEAKAVEAMAEARKKLEVNYYDSLSIQKEAYNIERDALLAAGAQAIEAAKESERGVGAAAGRVQMAQTEAQRKIASEMGKEMAGLEKLSASEDARLRDALANLDLAEVAGAQQAASNYGAMEAASVTQGMQGVQSLGSQIAGLVPLYEKSASAKGTEDILNTAMGTELGSDINSIKGALSTLGTVDGVNFQDVIKYNDINQLKAFLIGLDPKLLKLAGAKLQGYNAPLQWNNPSISGTESYN